MAEFITRHSLEFNPVLSPLAPNLCPYADRFNYVNKRKELGRLVGTNEFIFCIPLSCPFKFYESFKPVEWVIQIPDSRIRGYVHEQNWFDYLDGKKSNLEGVYFEDNPHGIEYSVLVDYPLQKDEIMVMRIFRFIDSQHAEILCEKLF
ncbi:MAG: hypothetical protein ACYSWW_05225 [Planctomycetota bacterium]